MIYTEKDGDSMYSKHKGMTDRDYTLTPPPGYDGSRFRRRSDGRDDAFPLYGESPKRTAPQYDKPCCEKEEPEEEYICEDEEEVLSPCQCCEESPPCEEKPKESPGILSFLQSLGSEEVLLIALILLLANDAKAGIDTILMLALLLCIT